MIPADDSMEFRMRGTGAGKFQRVLGGIHCAAVAAAREDDDAFACGGRPVS